ncbi:hypothetical protein BH23ACT12_BH23ACT12_07260 [soil metagenome]
MMKLSGILVLALMILMAACADNQDPDPSPSPSLSASATPSATVTAQPSPTPTAAPTGTPASCGTVTGGSEGTAVKLVAVRVGTHDGYDRIVFEFAPPKAPSPPATLAKYSITKVDEVTQDGSGNPVQIDGGALYSLVMQGASGVDLSGTEVVQTYTGPREFKPKFPVLTELELAGDFENALSWGIGLKAPRCVEATQFNSPLRLVLDIPQS